MKILETKEQNFLKIISKTLFDSSFLGDDCAILKKFNQCITHDTMVQDVHFDLNKITPYLLGKKAVLVNLSDVITSGAKPYGITISLSGKMDKKFICEFYKGVNEVCIAQKIKVLGGDLTAGDKIVVSIAALGEIKNRKISSRKNAKEGYIIAVAGAFGEAAMGLVCEKYQKAQNEPCIQFEIAKKIAKSAKNKYAMMDSSDGLIDCLAQISRASKVKMCIEFDKIPQKNIERELVLYGGEDFSLVACLAKADFAHIKGLTKIGEVQTGLGVFVDGENYSDKKWKGYKHFD